MLKRIRLFTLSVFFLLYTEGLLLANTHYSFKDADDFVPAPGLLYSDVLKPLPGPVAAAPPPPKRSIAAKSIAPPAKRRRAEVTSAAGRKSKKRPAPPQPVINLPAVDLLRDDYRRQTGRELIVTSAGRNAGEQAAAMYHNFVKYGSGSVVSGYRNKRAAREIAKAYEANRRRPRRAIAAMTDVITRQIGDGVFVSNHLRGKAVDLRSWGPHRARVKALRQIAQTRGWRVLVEATHIHVELS